MRTLNEVPIGAKVRTTRRDGSIQEGILVGFDGAGLIFEDSNGVRRSDIGPWVEIVVYTGDGWVVLPK